MRKIILFNLFCCFSISTLSGQNTNLSGIINSYAAVLNVDTCSGVVLVSSSVGLEVDMDVILYQAQGATMQEGDNGTFGDVVARNGAGDYEVNTIKSISGTSITLKNKPIRAYQVGGRVQLVSFSKYNEATVTDTLKSMPWNGTMGGVIALQVTGTLQLQQPVVASGAGFRGGAPFFDEGGNNCNWAVPIDDYWYGAGNWRAGRKGEGLAATLVDKECGRGKQANGGGGANDHNAGGGGGANNTSGGRGGNNEEPSLFGCDGNYPGNGGRLVIPGVTSPQLLLLGGGGGAGHANNGNVGAGGNGGGIIIIKAMAVSIAAGAYIAANGMAGELGAGDGGGGGGGGGAILLLVENGVTNMNISASGGNGGNSNNSSTNRCFGPGGGGGGGSIFSNISAQISAPPGGSAGIVTQSTNGCNNSTNGGTNGATGLSLLQVALPSSNVQNIAPSASFIYTLIGNTATFTSGAANYQSLFWVFDGNAVTSVTNPTYTFTGATGTAKLCAVGVCDTVCSEQTIVLNTLPNASIEVPDTISNCTSIQLTPVNNTQNASNYIWSFPGASPSTSTLPNPTVTYSNTGDYTITLIAQNGNLSDTTQENVHVDIINFPNVNFSYVVSGNGLVQFNNTSTNVTDFSWNFGDGSAISNEAFPTHNYTQSGEYTVTLTGTNICGAGVFQQVLVLIVLGTDTPTERSFWRVFPNPTFGKLMVQRQEGNDMAERCRLYNALGILVMEKSDLGLANLELDIRQMKAGVYRLEMVTKRGKFVWNIVKIDQ